MRYAIELETKKWARIQELIKEGRYDSVAQFIAVAIENQFGLETMPGEQTPLSQYIQPQAPEPVSVLLSKVERPDEVPELAEVASYPSEKLIWGLYNRIFPVKVTLRVLANLLVSTRKKEVDLRSLQDDAAIQARAIGKKLASIDDSQKYSRTAKLATGLPLRRGDKSLDRFKKMFVGRVSIKGKIEGFPAILQFISIRRTATGSVVSLTPAGYMFSRLPNPILDHPTETPKATLSTEESDFYLANLFHVMPREWNLCKRIVECIAIGKDTPKAVDEAIKEEVPALNSSLIPPERAGTISRLEELGLVRRRQDGLRVTYVLTKRGETYLKSKQEVAIDRRLATDLPDGKN